MFELLTVVLFIYLFFKVLGLVFRMTWGLAKIAAGILITIALPVFILCFLFVGGMVLLVPVLMMGIAFGIIKACV